eukprot:3665859-Ditylum_brightwellii.AAC.1
MRLRLALGKSENIQYTNMNAYIQQRLFFTIILLKSSKDKRNSCLHAVFLPSQKKSSNAWH